MGSSWAYFGFKVGNNCHMVCVQRRIGRTFHGGGLLANDLLGSGDLDGGS